LSKKNSVSKLPDWFQIKNYENTKKFDHKDWHRELSFRLYLQNALRSIEDQTDEALSLKFQKAGLFGFKELALNPTDTSDASKRINDYFRESIKHHRRNSEQSSGSTLSLFQSNLSSNQTSISKDADTFLKNYNFILPLQIKKPVDLLSPYGLKTLNKIYDERGADWFSAKLNELSRSLPDADLNIIRNVLTDSLHDESITGFIKNELESKDPEGKSEKELQIAGIKTTDEIIVVDLSNSDDILNRQFNELIKKLKADRQIPKKILKASENKLAKLSTYKVLPYIDLLLWGEFTKSPISEDLMDAVLFPNLTHTIDISKKFMDEALSISFLHSLAIT
jgi:hypothetical protein